MQEFINSTLGEGGMTIIMFGAMFLVFYFFMIRPQMKKAKEEKIAEKAMMAEKTMMAENVTLILGTSGQVVETLLKPC